MFVKKLGVSFYLFLFVFMGGSLLSISSSDWVGVWFGLEVNLFAVVPFFSGMGLSSEMESVIKYYIVQSIGSMIFLFGGILMCFECGSFFITTGDLGGMLNWVLVSGLILKMGLVPFHFWIPSVMSGLSWVGCVVLSVWQKLVPLVVLGSILSGVLAGTIVALGGLGSLIGGVGGFLQTQLRVLLGYSSIGHSGWVVVGILCSPVSGVCYFLLYSVLVVLLFFCLSYMDLYSFSSLGKGFGVPSVSMLSCLALSLVSLAGMPPTIGFAMKWSVFITMLPEFYLVLLFLVLGSLVSLYYYLCVIFSWCVIFFSVLWSNSGAPYSSANWQVLTMLVFSLAGLGGFFLVSGLCA